ncbi:MAG: nucleotidyltransferase domain-containing protein [Acetobacteraceae bacterium]|nr:nucleotidyltransferase domain-containing protein [Acetobacteraceae bacterium]
MRSHEADLRTRGVQTITLFGSCARGDASESSDVDLAFRPSPEFSAGGFDHFGRLESLREHLMELLGCDVDLVEEPVVRPRLRRIITEEGVRAF